MDLVLKSTRSDNPRLADYSDEELLEKYQRSGYQIYFEELVHRYQLPLYRYLLRYLKRNDVTEDVCQKCFLQLYLKNHQFQPGRRFKTWFYQIAINQTRDYLRRQRRYPMISLDCMKSESNTDTDINWDQVLPETGMDPCQAIILKEEREFVRQAITQLPLVLRKVVQLSYFQGMKYQEIADLLHIPYATIRHRLLTALKQLNRLLCATSVIDSCS